MKNKDPKNKAASSDTSLVRVSTPAISASCAVMKISVQILLFSICLTMVSCKTNSPLEKKVDEFFQTKRYKRAVKQRDSLLVECKSLKVDTLALADALRNSKAEYAGLDGKYISLKEQYRKLSSTSGMKLAQLSAELDNKSKELDIKARTMQEQERKLKEMQAMIARQDSATSRLNAIVKNALLGFKSDELTVKVKNGKVYVSMSDKLLFKSGSAEVEAKGLEALQKLAEVLNKNQDIDIFIEGHTDNIPIKTSRYADNWDLSVARATNIVRQLTEKYDVSAKRLTASGKGDNFPVASNDTPEGRAKNRRTEIILSP
ncbi:MAG TPA: OmpA family protein, partial [Bacteroidia bacterium]|nr:OmpA family protein [Bacteroidia bacterium]